MCLLLFSWQPDHNYPFIIAANRDEFYTRPTTPIGPWPKHPELLAGQDLQQQGTWLGFSRQGRFAAITNVREGLSGQSPPNYSRGHLVRDYLIGASSAQEWLTESYPCFSRYAGFNLILADTSGLWYYSNRPQEGLSDSSRGRRLEPGIYGLSNGILDSNWPKVKRGKQLFKAVLAHPNWHTSDLLTVLHDQHQPADTDLPDTGVELSLERLLSTLFIHSPAYGTRSSTVAIADKSGTITVTEQVFLRNGIKGAQQQFQWELPLAWLPAS